MRVVRTSVPGNPPTLDGLLGVLNLSTPTLDVGSSSDPVAIVAQLNPGDRKSSVERVRIKRR